MRKGSILRGAFASVLLLVSALLCQAQETTPAQELLEDGIRLFRAELYNQAILQFRNVLLDKEYSAHHADAYYWMVQSYAALNKREDAVRNLEYFLANYPDHRYYANAFYQKGRLAFLQKQYENAIQVLQSFIESYPESDYVPNAYFWVGESLFALGHLDEALTVHQTIVQDYPTSYKVEAAKYRVSLIQFKRREQELLKLLKWSHEESLKTVEEFRKRERTYEQTVVAYQRKLASYELAGFEEQIKELSAQLQARNEENSRLTTQVEELKQRVSSLQEARTVVAVTDATGEEGEVVTIDNRLLKLLAAKAEALAIKETMLTWLETYGGAE